MNQKLHEFTRINGHQILIENTQFCEDSCNSWLKGIVSLKCLKADKSQIAPTKS
jgi:hypothetical protein